MFVICMYYITFNGNWKLWSQFKGCLYLLWSLPTFLRFAYLAINQFINQIELVAHKISKETPRKLTLCYYTAPGENPTLRWLTFCGLVKKEIAAAENCNCVPDDS